MPKRERVAPEPVELALRALEHRDRSAAELRERLDRSGIPPDERDDVLERLVGSGLVDDGRLASNRASALAERGYGDAAIRADLARRHLDPEAAAAALAELEPELERARRLVSRRGSGPRTARFLVGRGFASDTVEAACDAGFANDP